MLLHCCLASSVKSKTVSATTCTLQAGALAAFLRELLMSPCLYAESLEEDLQRCLEVHFQDMPDLVPAQPGALPQESLTRLASKAAKEQAAAAAAAAGTVKS